MDMEKAGKTERLAVYCGLVTFDTFERPVGQCAGSCGFVPGRLFSPRLSFPRKSDAPERSLIKEEAPA
jgi:hypothetical protein